MGYTDFPLVNHHLPHETYSIFMFFLGITHVQTHPHGGFMALGFPHLTSLDIPPLAAGDTELCQEGEGFQGSGGKRPLGGGGTF